MQINGSQNNLLQLIQSPDKRIEDFLSSLESGDSLRGRVVSMGPGDNKAIINFKGFNVVSQLPENLQLQQGEIINVSVLNIDGKPVMKLIPPAVNAALSQPMPTDAGEALVNSRIINILQNMKIPGNEQNIFIAQKLIDYSLPLTRQNINEINSAVNSFLTSKGVNPETGAREAALPGSAGGNQPAVTQQIKEDILMSFIKLAEALNPETPQATGAGNLPGGSPETAAAPPQAQDNLYAGNTAPAGKQGIEIPVQQAKPQLQPGQIPGNVPQTQSASAQAAQPQTQLAGQAQTQMHQVLQLLQQLGGIDTANQTAQATQAAAKETQYGQQAKQGLAQDIPAQTTNNPQIQAQESAAPTRENAPAQSSGQAQAQAQQPQSATNQKQGVQNSFFYIRAAAAEKALQFLSYAESLNSNNTAKAALLPGDITAQAQDNTLTISIRNANTEALRQMLNTESNNGLLTKPVFDSATAALQQAQGKAVLSNNITLIKNNDLVQIKFTNIDVLAGQPATAAEGQSAAAIKSGVNSIRNLLDSTSNAGLKEITGALTRINAEASALMQRVAASPKGMPQTQALRQDIAALSDAVKGLLGETQNIPGSQTAALTPGLRAKLENFIDSIKNNSLLTGPKIPAKNQALETGRQNITEQAKGDNTNTNAQSKLQPFQTQANGSVNEESVIEAAVFLKSRNMPVDNANYVDMMSRYFGEDMKLSQTLSRLDAAVTRFNSLPQSFANAQTDKFITDVKTLSTDVKNIINEIAIKPESNGNAQNMELQLRNFIENSGLNLESRLKGIALNDNATPLPSRTNEAASENPNINSTLKSALIKLNDQISRSGTLKLTPDQNEALTQVRDASANILTNLNAMQFINQKPVSIDMLYTQIPVLFNNKLFHGELQIWYRKGSVKDNLDNSVPVNLAFVLNTTNLGSVKINLTVFKNDVEGSVRAEHRKAADILAKDKDAFLNNMKELNFNVRTFSIGVDENGNKAPRTPLSEGFVQIGRINFKA